LNFADQTMMECIGKVCSAYNRVISNPKRQTTMEQTMDNQTPTHKIYKLNPPLRQAVNQ
jgi:hypothetical protein